MDVPGLYPEANLACSGASTDWISHTRKSGCEGEGEGEGDVDIGSLPWHDVNPLGGPSQI